MLFCEKFSMGDTTADRITKPKTMFWVFNRTIIKNINGWIFWAVRRRIKGSGLRVEAIRGNQEWVGIMANFAIIAIMNIKDTLKFCDALYNSEFQILKIRIIDDVLWITK